MLVPVNVSVYPPRGGGGSHSNLKGMGFVAARQVHWPRTMEVLVPATYSTALALGKISFLNGISSLELILGNVHEICCVALSAE